MNTRLTGFVLILMLLAIGGIGGWLYGQNQTPNVSFYHQLIIEKTVVTADISSDESVTCLPICLRSSSRFVKALDMQDIGKRAMWIGSQVDFSEWAWEYQGHPLAYMQVWGPKEGCVYVQFSRASMTMLHVDIAGDQYDFTDSISDPPLKGLAWTFVEISETP